MRRAITAAAVTLVLNLGLVEPAVAAPCPKDSVASGTVCMDTYEASVWYVSPEEKRLITRIQNGKAGLADLVAAGAVQLGLANGDMAANGCPITGNGCVNVYAVSIPGVTPSTWVSYFQAAAAARNALKRLPTDHEWQAAALGAPDGAPCNVGPDNSYPANPLAIPAITGGAPGCISDVGAIDMVGNLWEWVADRRDSGSCFTLSPDFGSDLQCVGGSGGNSAVIRGGFFGPVPIGGGTSAGVFAARANFTVGFFTGGIGFRCAR